MYNTRSDYHTNRFYTVLPVYRYYLLTLANKTKLSPPRPPRRMVWIQHWSYVTIVSEHHVVFIISNFKRSATAITAAKCFDTWRSRYAIWWVINILRFVNREKHTCIEDNLILCVIIIKKIIFLCGIINNNIQTAIKVSQLRLYIMYTFYNCD